MRLIDADALIAFMRKGWRVFPSSKLQHTCDITDIENAPTVDAEPVVRCEDCEFSSTPDWDSDEVYCTKHSNWFKINGYCHLGRRKDARDNNS